MKKLTVTILCLVLFLVMAISLPAQNQQNKIVVNVDLGSEIISRHIYGHFAEHLGSGIYGGIWVGEDSPIPNTHGIRNDVVEALKELNIPNVRWPGGCFADEYHWMDGIGPRNERPSMINTHWGGVTEDNSFGTHEFMDLTEQLGTEPYIVGNVGSGTVQEMSQWVEYLTSDAKTPMTDLRKRNGREEPWRVKYWGIGNENWGCGGSMRAEYYADLLRRYSRYTRNYGDNELYRIGGGATNIDYDEVILKERRARSAMQGFSLHYYTRLRSLSPNHSATDFGEKEWFYMLSESLKIDDVISQTITLMDKYDPEKRIDLIVDEWGNWHDVEPGTNPGFLFQQNTLRDALVAAATLDIFNKHADRVKMANIAQLVNVLQALILTNEEQMVLTPTYYVYNMYKVHHDATLLPLDLQTEDYTMDGIAIPAISSSASKDDNGRVHISLSNLNPNKELEITCEIRGFKNVTRISGELLTANRINSYNDFSESEEVYTVEFSGYEKKGNIITVKLPPKSVVMLEII